MIRFSLKASANEEDLDALQFISFNSKM